MLQPAMQFSAEEKHTDPYHKSTFYRLQIHLYAGILLACDSLCGGFLLSKAGFW